MDSISKLRIEDVNLEKEEEMHKIISDRMRSVFTR